MIILKHCNPHTKLWFLPKLQLEHEINNTSEMTTAYSTLQQQELTIRKSIEREEVKHNQLCKDYQILCNEFNKVKPNRDAVCADIYMAQQAGLSATKTSTSEIYDLLQQINDLHTKVGVEKVALGDMERQKIELDIRIEVLEDMLKSARPTSTVEEDQNLLSKFLTDVAYSRKY